VRRSILLRLFIRIANGVAAARRIDPVEAVVRCNAV
jgi:hypothetical protein